MMRSYWLFLILVFGVMSCTNQKAIPVSEVEKSAVDPVLENDQADERVPLKNSPARLYLAENSDQPFSPEKFVRFLIGDDPEIVRIFPSPDFEKKIALVDQTIDGRSYFGFKSPLFKMPINGTDEMLAKIQHQTEIAMLNPGLGYTINMDMVILDNGSGKTEHKTITLKNVRPGVKIADFRREGLLKFTLKGSDGFRYAQYEIVSAIVIQEKEGLYHDLQAWLERHSDFPTGKFLKADEGVLK